MRYNYQVFRKYYRYPANLGGTFVDTVNNDYKKGFLPYAIAAAVLSLCGGLTAAVPSNIVADWGLAESSVTWLAMAYSLGAATLAPFWASWWIFLAAGEHCCSGWYCLPQVRYWRL